MPNAIGTNEIKPLTFSMQLEDAGLNTLPFAYGEDGTFNYSPAMTQAQKDQVQSIYTKHNPFKGRLVNYANQYQWDLATGGFTVTIDGVRRTFDTSSEGQSLINSTAQRLSSANGPASVDWQFDIHIIATISATDFLVATPKIMDFVHETFSVLQDTFTGINNNSITSQSQIDAMPWPAPEG
jgi:hypothetical protein